MVSNCITHLWPSSVHFRHYWVLIVFSLTFWWGLYVPSTSLPALVIWTRGSWGNWMASQNVCCRSPRRVSSALNGGRSCCTQIPPAGTVPPSCHVYSLTRLRGTALVSRSAAHIDHPYAAWNCWESAIYAKVGAHSVPEISGEFCAVINGDIVRYAMLADSMFEHHSC